MHAESRDMIQGAPPQRPLAQGRHLAPIETRILSAITSLARTTDWTPLRREVRSLHDPPAQRPPPLHRSSFPERIADTARSHRGRPSDAITGSGEQRTMKRLALGIVVIGDARGNPSNYGACAMRARARVRDCDIAKGFAARRHTRRRSPLGVPGPGFPRMVSTGTPAAL
jgi:hypothetical protein